MASSKVLFSLGRSWISTTYHGVMFITWMKKAVSEEVDGECKPLNILSLAIADLNTSYSANLELVTIIECICADGESLKPGFIFPGKEFHPEWFQVDNDIR
jgi:hypothetical protein